jgi:hypothetical protein
MVVFDMKPFTTVIFGRNRVDAKVWHLTTYKELSLTTPLILFNARPNFRRYDSHPNDTQHNDTQHIRLTCDNQHNRHSA